MCGAHACRAEAARNELAHSQKGLRREAGQQMRELESGRGEALRLLQEVQAAGQQREQALLVRVVPSWPNAHTIIIACLQ